MKKNIFNASLVAILVIGGIVAYFIYNNLTQRPSYSTATVQKGNVKQTLNLNGKVLPQDSADLGFEIGGKITNFTHAVGDYVAVGTPLAYADSTDINATVRQTQSLVQSAQAVLDQDQAIVKKSKEQLDSLKHEDANSHDKDAQKGQIKADEAQVAAQQANVAAAQAGVQIAQAQLDKTVITAPFAGVISKQDVKVGETAQADNPIITLISKDSFKVEVFVSELDVQNLQVGDQAQITLDDNPGQNYNAKITAIDPAETSGGNVSSYKVTLNFNDNISNLRSGVGANVTVIGQTKEDVVTVSQNAVFESNGKKYVYVLENGLRVEKEVQTGIYGADGNVEITSGLNAGDIIFVLNK